MAQDYAELAAFMRGHSSDPLALAKIMVAWEWTSLLPGGPNGPTSVESVPTVLKGECGWRDALLEALFSEIDVPHRRVNFHNVPFQVGHSATELFINGKWMFFDGSLGIYFELEGGSAPLSMAEARGLWPDVVVKQCSLPGWQGLFVDPNSIRPEVYKTRTDMFFVPPEAYSTARDWIRAEIESVYSVLRPAMSRPVATFRSHRLVAVEELS